MKKFTLPLLIGLVAVAVAIAGCGGGGDATAASSSGSSMASSGSGGKTVSVSDNGKLGKILVDSAGHTVYLFNKDTGSKSMCSGGCAAEWGPVTTSGKPSAGTGVTASKLGTTARSDGKTQVTYNGHPLYTFVGDSKAGDVAGQGLNDFGSTWWVVSPAGNEVTGGGSGSSSSSGASYGY
jgi:predicted lipoprotein with Yx(FWY)xxD motif